MKALPFLLLILTAAAIVQAQPAGDSLEARRKALKDLLAEQWENNLKNNPEFASILGDKRYNDQVSQFTIEAIHAQQEQARQFLVRFKAIDTTGFPEQEVLNKRLMVRDLEHGLDGARFKGWEMPIDQMNGIHLQIAQVQAVLPFDTVKDYRDYITRLHKLPTLFDQTIVQMRQGMKDGLMPPRFLLEKVVGQADGIAKAAPDKSPFAEPLKRFPEAVPAADREKISKDMLAAIQSDVLPAYAKLRDFVRDEYAPKGRTDVGVWSLPDGPERYAWNVRESTTTNMTPEEVHQLGLKQVTEIEAQEKAIFTKLGFADLKAFKEAVNKDPKFHPASREAILELYRSHVDDMYGKLPQLFGRLPKGRMTVVATEAFREKEAAAAEYQQGTPDGSRPGRVNVNTGDFANRLTLDMESTAYHEGVPGHHMQIAIAQELPTLPPFRQQEGYTAYVEGWALYAERLGKEVGFYKDPYSDYGRLESEMLRAIRLVVDSGLHYKKWTRQQVVDYFHAHSNISEPEVQSETDRYIAWPSQALAYKVGQLTILSLREKARQELGDHFDIRAFHDEVLGAGALPMDVLSERINAWIVAQKAAGGPAASAK